MDKKVSSPDDAGNADHVELGQIRPSVNADRRSTNALVEEAHNLETEPNTARHLLEGREGDPQIEVEQMDASAIIRQQAKKSVLELMEKYELQQTNMVKGGQGVASLETSADHKIPKSSRRAAIPTETELDDGRKKRYKEVFGEFDFSGKKRVQTPDISFDADWEPKLKNDWMGNRIEFKEQTKVRREFLWAKLRYAVFQPGLLETLEEKRQAQADHNFGLRDMKRVLDSDEEEEMNTETRSEIRQREDSRLPWYICDPTKNYVVTWVVLIQFLNWSSVILVPLTLVFEEVKQGTIDFMWFIDIVWSIEIILKFFRATEKHRSFKKTALGYLKNDTVIVIGEFWFDAVATFTPMIFLQMNLRINTLKLLRFYHFSTMMLPFKIMLEFCLTGHKSNSIKSITSFTNFIISVMLMVHFVACFWISIGKSHDDLPEEERASWISDPNSDFVDMKWHQIFIFSYYWIFETVTTVGYGDYSGSTPPELVFSIFLEFAGLTFFSLLMGLMGTVLGVDDSFEGLISDKFQQMDIWIQKIERSKKPLHLQPILYSKIAQNVENAMLFDFNLIIEEFSFYQQVTPKMQTEIIETVFGDFAHQFRLFFDYCETGFKNEFIISMLCRLFEEGDFVHKPGDKFRTSYFIKEGCVSIYSAQLKGPLMIYGQDSWFGDYQALFNKKSKYYYKCEREFGLLVAIKKMFAKTNKERARTKDGKAVKEKEVKVKTKPYFFMCIETKTLLDLVDLYPETGESIKYIALERRKRMRELVDQKFEEAGDMGMQYLEPTQLEDLAYDKFELDYIKKYCTFDVTFDSDEEMDEGEEDELDQEAISSEVETMKRQMRVLQAKLKTLMKEISDGTIQIKRVSKPLVPHNFPSGDSDDTMMNLGQSVIGMRSNRGSVQHFEQSQPQFSQQENAGAAQYQISAPSEGKLLTGVTPSQYGSPSRKGTRNATPAKIGEHLI